MMNVGKWHQWLAYAAAVVALLSVILAGIAKLAGATIVIAGTSYMTIATVAILFAIYFLVQGAISADKGK